MSRIFAILVCFALLALPTLAAGDRIDGIAQAIEDNYFDAARGKAIADTLRRDAGRYVSATDAELAAALTERLRPLDRHFRVALQNDVPVPADAAPRKRMLRRATTGDQLPGMAPRRERPRTPADHRSAAATGIRAVDILAGNVGYLSLGEFAHFEFDAVDDPVRTAIDTALGHIAGTRAVIIDVRGNRGGSPHLVGYLVSAFVAPDADVYNTFRSRFGNAREAPAENYARARVDVPLAVLIDARTGSAAESFAYTLQQARRAITIGETSGGAANPGAEIDAGNGFTVFVSTGSPINPISGGNWEGGGVKPDVEVPSAQALETALARL
jgi:hypothetical protein